MRKMDPKSMRTIVETDLKLSPLKLKKRQHLTVLQQRKRADLLWNFLKSGTQKGEIVFSDETYSLWSQSSIHKRQNAGRTLRGRSWKHVNRLSAPEACIYHGLGCSVKNLEISDFCETGCRSQHKCVHQWYFCPCFVIWKST